MNINIPDELYQELAREAGNIPVDSYITSVIATARRYRPQVMMVQDLDTFLQALQPWEAVLNKVRATVYGTAGGAGTTILPNGRVQVTTGGFFLAQSYRIGASIVTGELSERFRQGSQPNVDLFSKAWSGLRWERVAPGEPPLDADDLATFERTKEVGDKMREALTRLGVRLADVLRRRRDDTQEEQQGPHV